mgnify:CR=1 FL=1|jgi:hypothetical protein
MRKKTEFLNVDFIGGLGALTKEDEQKLSEYFKNKKKAQSINSNKIKKSKSKSQKV